MDLQVAKRFMDELLVSLYKKGGSDLFIIAGAAPAMRIHGKIAPVMDKKLTAEHTLALAQSVMTPEEREEFRERKECNFAIALPKLSRYRVNALVQRGSAGLVVRIIPNEIPHFEDLNLPGILQQIAMTKRGLVIFVGGTGSGKSTSLASLIDYRNKNTNGHIITIEDPVEFVHNHQGCIVTQREVGTDTESFEVACLATLHANNANQAFDRVINFFPEARHNQLLLDMSLNLKAFISQRLLPTPDGKGRRAAVEVLINTPLMADLIQRGEIHEIKALMQKSTEQGMQTFDQALFDLLSEGSITIEEAMRNADSVNDLRLRIKLDSSNDGAIDDMISSSMSIADDDDEDKGQSMRM